MVSSQESRIMSVYLPTAVIILFEYVENHTSDGSKFCLYYQVGKKMKENPIYILLSVCLNFTKNTALLPNQEMIAIHDLPLVPCTYHEPALLYDDLHLQMTTSKGL